ncbi:bifunctional D-glycero-beta-D-manno-heptose-7-phosphate kinase/D-glycero-beta-D-manno-heptose 1-phosphate adenylyltransferase HldE [Limisalsivibrio acetivorans]|uniref:bifunctional D-glycero-beta-D-manno-heptose-7-phosphate kinase/D-glycero-beta-D-manno-heptose 1-phosphate adenylyltransferase HldE n=1 Tax=Limisalsivibrio acetivorans TaxID=1304888 RepID=UPI0003B42004|nr:bifunctional D-glycero-beta-D-manno-heptose-7-phosphate kinase/D-glycero-beta-D-manno-heptose 1-phosphate adenylyltransferase HldE [Limisalsivibrio acetivorans]
MKVYDFTGVKVLVVGDIMLDRYFFGSVGRISPEAPVPVVKVNSTRDTLGGAGNVVSNIAHLGADAVVLGSCGRDENAEQVRSLLSEIGAECSFIERDFPTVTKLRVVGEKQQIVRLDFEEPAPLQSDDMEEMRRRVDDSIDGCGAVILSDYGKGVCTDEVCRYIIGRSIGLEIPVIIDPKGHDWTRYKGADIVTPNVKELGEVAGRNIPNEDDEIIECAREVIERFGVKSIIVTRSQKGMSIITEESVVHIPTVAKEVYDVSGAGDTVVATLAASLSRGASLEEAAITANKAAGIVVSKMGTVPVKIDELNSLNTRRSYMTLDEFMDELEGLRGRGKKVVFTNGCFDILHKGHVTYLKQAKELGDVLVLGLNSDESVRRLKGESRPVNSEEDRAEVLSALESVDYVVPFGEDTPAEMLSRIKPDFLVKGGDYTPETVVGREYAAKTVIIDFVDGYSTTKIIDKSKGE